MMDILITNVQEGDEPMPSDKNARDIRKQLKDAAAWGGRITSGTARMFLASGRELFNLKMPVIADMAEVNNELITDITKIIRNPVDALNRGVTRAMNTEDYKAVAKFAKDALGDLKSGNIYDPNRDRNSASNYIDDLLNNFGGFDMDGFDENGDWSESDSNGDMLEGEAAIVDVQEENASKRTAATIEAIGTSTEAITQTITANNQANIRMSLKQHAQTMNMLSNSLNVQVSTLSAIDMSMKANLEVARESHKQIMEQMQTMTSLLTEIRDGVKPPKKADQYKEREMPFGVEGGFDIRKYIKMVIKNIDSELGITSAKSIAMQGMNTKEFLELMQDNPWMLVTNAIVSRIVPERLQSQMERTNRNIKNFFPALLESLYSRKSRTGPDGTVSLKDSILGMFGIKSRSRSSIETRVEDINAQAAFTNRTAIAVEQVIPTLLSKINSSISGEPLLSYDYKAGKFKNTREVFSEYTRRSKDLVGSMSIAQDFMNLAGTMNFKSNKDRKEFQDYLYQFFQGVASSSSNRFINPFMSENEFKKMMPNSSNKDYYYKLMMAMFNAFDRSDLMELSSEILDARATRDKRNFDIHNELRDTGLMQAFSGILGKDLMTSIEKSTMETRSMLSADALENLERKKKELALKSGGVKATNILLDSILGTLKKGIITYSIGLGDISDSASDLEKIRKSVMNAAVSRDTLEADIVKRINAAVERKNEWTRQEIANTERRIKLRELNTEPRNTVMTEDLDIESMKASLAAIRAGSTSPGESGNPLVEEYRKQNEKLKGGVRDVLDKTGVTGIFGKISKLAQSPFSIMEDALKFTDAFMFKLLYGEDAMMDAANGSKSFSLMDTVTRAVQVHFNDAKEWFGKNIGEPLRDILFHGEDSVGGKLRNKIVTPIKNKVKDTTNKLKERFIGTEVKDENGNVVGYTGGKFSEQMTALKSKTGNVTDRVTDAFDYLLYGKYSGEKRKGVKTVMDRDEKGRFTGSHKEYGGVMGTFKRGFDGISRFLFGDDNEKDPEARAKNLESRAKWKLVKTEVGKAAPDMILGAGAGVLASLFLPGGPLLGALIGSFGGLVNGSEKFKRYLFGDEIADEPVIDPETGKPFKNPFTGKDVHRKSRKGGVISKEVYDAVKQYAPKIGAGALAGAAAGGLGLLPFGIGPVIGGVLGSIGGMTAASNQLKKMIFGDGIDEKSGLISKEFRKKVTDTVKKYAPASVAGALAGNTIWNMGLGLIPGLSLLPGGPIFTLLGAITGGSNAEAFNKLLFGEEVEETVESTDGNGNKTTEKRKRRKGGMFGSIFDTAKNKIIEPFGKIVNSVGKNIGEWFKKDIVAPFGRALEPMKNAIGDGLKRAGQSLKNIGTTITNSIKTSIGKSVDDSIGKFFKEKVVKPLEGIVNRIFSTIGRAIGGIISAPFKALELIFTGRIQRPDEVAPTQLISDRAKQQVKSEASKMGKRVSNAQKSSSGFGAWLRNLFGRGKNKPKADPSKAGQPGYTRQGVPIEGYEHLPDYTENLDGISYETPGLTAGMDISDVTSYTGAGDIGDDSYDIPDTGNVDTDNSNNGDIRQELTRAEKNRRNAEKRKRKRDERNAKISAKQAKRNEKRKARDEEIARKRAERNGTTVTDESRYGNVDEDGKRRKVGRKSDNEYLSIIANNTKKIFNEIKGQVNGVGWNTAYIKTLLEIQNGGPLDPSQLPEEMEGSTKSIKKRRGFFGKAKDRVTGMLTGAKDWLVDKGRAARDKLDYLFTPVHMLADAIGAVKDHILGFGDILKKGASALIGAVGETIKTFGAGAKDILLGITGFIKEAGGGLGAMLGDIGKTLTGVTSDIALALTGVTSGLVRVAAEIAPDIVAGLWKGFKYLAKGAFGLGIGAAKGAAHGLSWLFGKITGRQVDEEGNLVKVKKKYLGNVHISGGTVDSVNSVEDIKIGPAGAKFTFPYVYASNGKMISKSSNFSIPVFIVGSDPYAKIHVVDPSDNAALADDYKNTYNKVDAAAEKSSNPGDVYDRAMRNAKTEEEVKAIQAAQQMNANNASIASASGKDKKDGGILSTLSSLFGGAKGILSKLLTIGVPAIASIAAMAYGSSTPGKEGVAMEGGQTLTRTLLNTTGLNKLSPNQIKQIVDNPAVADTVAAGVKSTGKKGAVNAAKGISRFGGIMDFVKMIANPADADAAIALGKEAGLVKGLGLRAQGTLAKGIGGIGRTFSGFATDMRAGASLYAEAIGNKLAPTKIGKAASTVAGVASKVKNGAKNLLGAALDKLFNNKVVKSLLGTKLMKKIATVKTTIIAKLTGEAFEKAAKMSGKETLEGILRTIGGIATGGILTAAFAVADFITGWNSAATTFNVHSNAITLGMKATSAIVRTLSGLVALIPAVGTILSIALSIVEDVLVQEVYKIFANDDEDERVAKAQEVARAGAEAAGMSVDEYVKKYDENGNERKGFLGTVWDGIKNVVSYTSGGIVGTLNRIFGKDNAENGSGLGTGRVTPMSQRAGKYNRGSQEMALAGCGPTAAAMVGSAYGDKRTPLDANTLSYGMGMRASDGGTNPAFFSQYAGSFGAGYGMQQGPNSSAMVEKNLKNGQPVVLMGRGGKFGEHMHYLVADGMAGRGKMSIVDPMTGGRKTAGIGEIMQNTKSTVYSWGTGTEVSVGSAQQALVDKMNSIRGQIAYSLSGPQDPDKGSASCASTVGWAYRKVLGLDNMSASSATQSKDSRFVDIVRLGQPGAQPGKIFDTSVLQPGDIVYMYNKFNNGGGSNHTEMYIGDGKDLSHGGPDAGPQLRTLNADRQKRVFAVRRYKGFVNGTVVPVTDGYDDASASSSTTESDGWLSNSVGFKALNAITSFIGGIGTKLDNKLNQILGVSSGEDSEEFTDSGTDASSSNFNASDSAKKNWEYLTKNGYSPIAAAGIMGCWQSESSNRSDRLEGDYLWKNGNPNFQSVLASNKSLNDYTLNWLFPRMKEGSYNPNGYKGTDGNYYPGMGLAQWTASRAQNLMKFAKETGGDWRDQNTQLQFFNKEATDSGFKNAINTAKSPSEAAEIALDKYEMSTPGFGSRNPNYLNPRQANANAIYQTYTGGEFGAGAGIRESLSQFGRKSNKLRFHVPSFGTGQNADANISALNDKIRKINNVLANTTNESNETPTEKMTRSLTTAISNAGVGTDSKSVEILTAIAESMKTMVELLTAIKGNTEQPEEGPTSGQDTSASKNRYGSLPIAEGSNPVYDGTGYEVGKSVIDRLTRR